MKSYYIKKGKRIKIKPILTIKLLSVFVLITLFCYPIYNDDLKFFKKGISEKIIIITDEQINKENKRLIENLKTTDPLLYCMAKIESTFDPLAINHNDGGSRSVGLLQFK
ncbi:MAG: hypothetical protein WC917_02590, partial [Bacilli bacterium]